MTLRSEKLLSLLWVSLGALLCFEALIYILNLNQPGIFIRLALAVAVYLTLQIAFFYDLHFKTTGKFGCEHKHISLVDWSFCRVKLLVNYGRQRLHHFRHWKTLRHWIHCMGMPTLLYWATVGIIFLNFNRQFVQQLFAITSTMALAFFFWHLKEIYLDRGEQMKDSAHVVFQAIKLYSAFTIFLASLGLVQHFCLSYWSLGPIIFVGIFTLMYQSLFHMQKISPKTVASLGVISTIISLIGGLVFLYWGVSYTTGALFLMGIYNFFWGLYYYFLRGKLTWAIFWEFFLVTVLICALSAGITNFKSRILPYC